MLMMSGIKDGDTIHGKFSSQNQMEAPEGTS